MLVALSSSGVRLEATRDLPDDEFECPVCNGPMALKRGRVKVPHFAHLPGADCWSEPESVTHLRAKQLLVAMFRALGYQATPEEVHHQHGRRIDVAVTVHTGHRVAIEIQDSPIAVEEMKSRTRLDRRMGFIGTIWVFTDKRVRGLLDLARNINDDDYIECRIPNEVLWVSRRFGQGTFVLDVDDESVWNLGLMPVHTREGYDQDGGVHYYAPRTLRQVTRSRRVFALTCKPGRYEGEWAVVFDELWGQERIEPDSETTR